MYMSEGSSGTLINTEFCLTLEKKIGRKLRATSSNLSGTTMRLGH